MDCASGKGEWCGVREVRKFSGMGSAKLLRHVLLGEVEAKLVPGKAPLYSREDVERIASESGR